MTRLAQESPASGRRCNDAATQPNDSGSRDAGSNRAPTNRESPNSVAGRPHGSGSGDAKNPNAASPGASAAINDVRRRLGGSKGQNYVQQPTDRLVLNNAANRGNTTQKNAFQDRLKAGDFNRLTTGQTGKKLQLAQQFRMSQKGDVARRMNLQNHGGHSASYRGVVSRGYEQQCMRFNYWGSSCFAGMCWYPMWSSWVEWSWHHRCRPYWDPRPIWCRPMFYRPCPAWVYWNTPAWTPLPETACGTWVDPPPVEIVPDCDLQLLAVRFVDPGHPEERLGPRYRVWFRNTGSLPVTQPFSVMLFAGNDERLAANMPQAGVRVTGINAGEVQSVDIRLPVEVYALQRDARGNPVPFSVLQVLVDANREVAETNYANNGAILAPAAILPIDPASFELQPGTATPGAEILLAGEGLGPQPGRVLIQINGREMDGEILGWYDLGVRWTVPQFALARAVEANVVVIRGDGIAANPVRITLTP